MVRTTSPPMPAAIAAGESSGTRTRLRGIPDGKVQRVCVSESPTAVGVKPNDRKVM